MRTRASNPLSPLCVAHAEGRARSDPILAPSQTFSNHILAPSQAFSNRILAVEEKAVLQQEVASVKAELKKVRSSAKT